MKDEELYMEDYISKYAGSTVFRPIEKMKIYIWLFLLILLPLACKKETPGEKPKLSPNHWGEASAQKNGLSWTADPVCWIDIVDHSTMLIELDSSINGYFLTESLTFHEVPATTGSYDIFKSAGSPNGEADAYLSFWESDFPLGLYHVLEGHPNQLTISSLDTTSKEIKGSFTLTLLVDHRPYPGAPDTIRFTNGQFHGRLYK